MFVYLYELSLTYSSQPDGSAESVKVTGAGHRIKEDYHAWEGQNRFPETMGNFTFLAPARNIGTVRTPYWHTRRRVPGENGVSIVTQVTSELSVAANLTNDGAMEFALRLIENVFENYRHRHPTEKLIEAHEATRIALLEVSDIESKKRSEKDRERRAAMLERQRAERQAKAKSNGS